MAHGPARAAIYGDSNTLGTNRFKWMTRISALRDAVGRVQRENADHDKRDVWRTGETGALARPGRVETDPTAPDEPGSHVKGVDHGVARSRDYPRHADVPGERGLLARV